MSEAKETTDREETLGASPDLSRMLDKVLSNPEILSSVAAALSKDGKSQTKEIFVNEQKEKEVAGGSPDIEAMMQNIPDVMKIVGPMMSKGDGRSAPSRPNDKRACLLSAMKPYLNSHRCEAIDYIIRISELSELIKKIH